MPVVVHGFTGSWREERVQKVVTRLRAFGGIVAIDMRGHGRSGGSTTVGDEEVLDVAAAVEWARELGYLRVVTVGLLPRRCRRPAGGRPCMARAAPAASTAS